MIAMATVIPYMVAALWEPACAAAKTLAAARDVASLATAANGLVAVVLPALIFGVFYACLEASRRLALSVQKRLTSGMHDYPPPRNLAVGAKGSNRELRTVEQGRSS